MGSSEAQAMDAGIRLKKIALEEHANGQELENLDKRLRDMDEAGIDIQVLSYRGEMQGPAPAEFAQPYLRG